MFLPFLKHIGKKNEKKTSNIWLFEKKAVPLQSQN